MYVLHLFWTHRVNNIILFDDIHTLNNDFHKIIHELGLYTHFGMNIKINIPS